MQEKGSQPKADQPLAGNPSWRTTRVESEKSKVKKVRSLQFASVAQWIRAAGFYPVGRGFESLPGYKISKKIKEYFNCK